MIADIDTSLLKRHEIAALLQGMVRSGVINARAMNEQLEAYDAQLAEEAETVQPVQGDEEPSHTGGPLLFVAEHASIPTHKLTGAGLELPVVIVSVERVDDFLPSSRADAFRMAGEPVPLLDDDILEPEHARPRVEIDRERVLLDLEAIGRMSIARRQELILTMVADVEPDTEEEKEERRKAMVAQRIAIAQEMAAQRKAENEENEHVG
ncbi:hypothetical protein [Rhizobium sp. BG4]|uniref:hypothetical protein n=1 Tax=Rhizobium sp. BG4 TaxID=2613770 RepID=UPI00193D8CB2|nr:hypothetical protein [Rhizobium sp. BG4]QRM45349.1 hypothetical protein F2982_19025 [Rhizobium sp. BG4]